MTYHKAATERPNGSRLRFGVVIDNLASRLLTPFQRLHKNDEYQEIRIGLATVQRVIVRRGGRVWTEVFPGQGAAFYFSLPK